MSLMFRRTFSNASYHFLLYGVACLLVFGAAWLASSHSFSLRKPEVQDYGLRSCELSGGEGNGELRILDALYLENYPVFEPLCSAASLAARYSRIVMRSVHRDRVDLRDLYESRYQLVLAKTELLGNGSDEPARRFDYKLIAQYPDYGSQLIASEGLPELTVEWMTGRKLGLMDDPNSVSAYQIPTAALRARGLSEVPEIVYFRSYRQMIRAFFSGEVDVIAVFLSQEGPESRLNLPPGLVLEQTLPGPGWYIADELLRTDFHCGLLEALQQLTASAPVDFFKSLRVVEPCDAP